MIETAAKRQASRHRDSGNGIPRDLPQNLTKLPQLRVAMLTFLFPPNFAGGTKQALALANALRSINVDCSFLAANFENAPSFEIFEGSPVHRVTTARSGRARYLLYALKVCVRLSSLRKEFDLIFLHSLRPFSLLIVLLAKLMNKPVLITLTLIGNDDPRSLKQKSFLWRAEVQSLRFADRVICKSSAIRNICLRQGLDPQKLVSIPNGVDARQFRPATDRREILALRKSFGLRGDDFIVAFVGRVCKRKGCDILFDAWEVLAKKHAHFTLLVIGPHAKSDAADRDPQFDLQLRDIMARAQDLRIQFLGKTEHGKLAEYLRLSDTFVFPSRKEGLPNAVLEAMASGLPTIAMRLPGITDEIIENGVDGIILDDHVSHDLAAAIERIADGKSVAKSLSSNAVRNVNERFSIESVASRHRELYQSLIRRA
jgi:glycosyltransferase involved in cell wall biosynthesis